MLITEVNESDSAVVKAMSMTRQWRLVWTCKGVLYCYVTPSWPYKRVDGLIETIVGLGAETVVAEPVYEH